MIWRILCYQENDTNTENYLNGQTKFKNTLLHSFNKNQIIKIFFKDKLFFVYFVNDFKSPKMY